MSIIRIAVENHLKKSHLTIRELLESAYFRRYGKILPQATLDEDVRKWENGVNNIPYLFDFIIGHECAQ